MPSFDRKSIALGSTLCQLPADPVPPGLVRFIPTSTSEILIGQPVDSNLDVGAAILAGKEVQVETYNGTSVLSPGTPTGKTVVIRRLLSPLAESEVGTIRCIGLNVSRKISPETPGHLIMKVVCTTCPGSQDGSPRTPHRFHEALNCTCRPISCTDHHPEVYIEG